MKLWLRRDFEAEVFSQYFATDPWLRLWRLFLVETPKLLVKILKFKFSQNQRVAYHIGKLSNAEISDFSVSRRVYRVEPRISSTFDKLGEGLWGGESETGVAARPGHFLSSPPKFSTPHKSSRWSISWRWWRWCWLDKLWGGGRRAKVDARAGDFFCSAAKFTTPHKSPRWSISWRWFRSWRWCWLDRFWGGESGTTWLHDQATPSAQALISYRIERKTLISYRYRIESKKSLSLLDGLGWQLISKYLFKQLANLIWNYFFVSLQLYDMSILNFVFQRLDDINSTLRNSEKHIQVHKLPSRPQIIQAT